MKPLPFVDGPRDGESYALVKDQPMPSEIRLKGGKYVLVKPAKDTPFAPYLEWREHK